ncbi:MAG: type II secretion system protein GspM [Methylococcales bacterium]
MTLDNLTAKQKSFFAAGLMILVIVSLTLGVIMPMVSGYYANKQSIAQLQMQLQRYTGKVASRESVIAQTAELKSTIMGFGIFSAQKSIPLVLAEMQEKIKTAVSNAGGELTSTQNLSQKPVDGLVKLGINASFSGKIENLKNILYELESAKPYLMIENIKIYGAGNELGSASGKIDAVNIILVVADIVTYIPPVAP